MMGEACRRLEISRSSMLRYIQEGFFTNPSEHKQRRGKAVRYLTEDCYLHNAPKIKKKVTRRLTNLHQFLVAVHRPRQPSDCRNDPEPPRPERCPLLITVMPLALPTALAAPLGLTWPLTP
jgi:hypothetical protein